MTKKTFAAFGAIDRSGSMSGEKWTNAIESFNVYVKGLQKEKIEGEVTLVAFDSITGVLGDQTRLETILDAQSIAYFTPINSNVLSPSGMTPLYDAAANVMDRALERNE